MAKRLLTLFAVLVVYIFFADGESSERNFSIQEKYNDPVMRKLLLTRAESYPRKSVGVARSSTSTETTASPNPTQERDPESSTIAFKHFAMPDHLRAIAGQGRPKPGSRVERALELDSQLDFSEAMSNSKSLHKNKRLLQAYVPYLTNRPPPTPEEQAEGRKLLTEMGAAAACALIGSLALAPGVNAALAAICASISSLASG